jgi:hypothetical protein
MELTLTGLIPTEQYTYILQAREAGCSHIFFTDSGQFGTDINGQGTLTLVNNMPGELEFTYTLDDGQGGVSNGVQLVPGTGDMQLCCDLVPKIPSNEGEVVIPTITVPVVTPITVNGDCVINALCSILVSIDNGVLNNDGFSPEEVQLMLDNLAADAQAQINAYAISVVEANDATQNQINALLADICMKASTVHELLPGTIA